MFHQVQISTLLVNSVGKNEQSKTKQTNLVPCKSIKLCYTVTQRTISINNPDLWIWAAKLGPQGKATTHPKSPKCTWIQPRQWTSWPEIRKQGYCFTSFTTEREGEMLLFSSFHQITCHKNSLQIISVNSCLRDHRMGKLTLSCLPEITYCYK